MIRFFSFYSFIIFNIYLLYQFVLFILATLMDRDPAVLIGCISFACCFYRPIHQKTSHIFYLPNHISPRSESDSV